jgi:peroxiredoxin
MASDQNRKHLSEGEMAPPFELVGFAGETHFSPDLLNKGPLLLTFYRGAWCSCCRADLRDIVSAMHELHERSLTVLGVFYELASEACARINTEYALNFPLVNDTHGRVAEAFGIRRSAREFEEIRRELGPELLALKDGEPWILPMQARFLIGSDGIVARTEIALNYEDRCQIRTFFPTVERLMSMS